MAKRTDIHNSGAGSRSQRTFHEAGPVIFMLALLALPLASGGCDLSAYYDRPDIPDAVSDLPFEPPDNLVTTDDGSPGFFIDNAEPLSGPAAGGTRVAISGKGFSKNSRVFFGSSEGLETIVENETSIRTTTPPGTGYTETVDIAVVRPDGKRTVLRPGFRYEAKVELVSVTPAAGPVSGGTPIVVKGHGFSADSFVVIDGRVALECRRIDDSTILAVTPPGDSGSVEISVDADGTSGRLPAGFRYLEQPERPVCLPRVIDISGPDGDKMVSFIMIGDALEQVEQVSLSAGTVISTTVGADGHLEVRADFSQTTFEGPVDVHVSGPGGAAVSPACFTALKPETIQEPELRIWAISPSSAPSAGGLTGTLTVTGLTWGAPSGLLVRLGGSTGSVTEVPDDNTIRFHIIEGSPGTVDVTLETPHSTAVLENGFTYLRDHEITSVTPSTVDSGGGTDIVIDGMGLSDAVEVFTGPLPAKFTTPPSDKEITVRIPSLGPGIHDISVLFADGSKQTLPAALTSVADRLTVKSISPDHGSIAGGTFVWITGDGMVEGSRVFFGDNEATILPGQDPGRIAVKTPAADGEETVDVFVVGPDGIRYRLSSAFTYFNPVSWMGGVWGGKISGSVNVTVLDSYSDEPVPDAFVMLGSDSDTEFKGFTDGRGMITLSGRRLTGPVMVTATRQDYTTWTVAGTDGSNVTLFLEPLYNEIENGSGGGGETFFPPTPGIITGIVTGTEKEFIAPALDCRGVELVNGPLCRSCGSDFDCGPDHVCVMSGATTMTCSKSCLDKSDCPDGFDCYSTVTQGPVCKPSPGEPEIHCAVADSSSTRWSENFGPGSVVNDDGVWALNSRLGDVAVFCRGGYRDRTDGGFIPIIMGINRHLQVRTATVSDGHVIKLNIPLSRKLRVRMISPPDGEQGPSIHNTYLSMSLGSDGYLNLWKPESIVNGNIFEFDSLPENMNDALEDAKFFVSTEAVADTSTGEPYSVVYPTEWKPTRPEVLSIDKLIVDSHPVSASLDVVAGCELRCGGGIVIDSTNTAWLVDESGFISALPRIDEEGVTSCTELADQKVLFTGGRSRVHFVDMETMDSTLEHVHNSPVNLNACAASEAGLIWVTGNGRIFVRNLSGTWSEPEYTGGTPIHDLAALPDETIIAAGARGTIIRASEDAVWSFRKGGNDLLSVAVTTDGNLVIAGERGTILSGSLSGSLSGDNEFNLISLSSGVVDDLITAVPTERGVLIGGSRGLVLRIENEDMTTVTTIRQPTDRFEISALIPLGCDDPDASVLVFRRSCVNAGPFINIMKFSSPISYWLWQDRTISWTIPKPPEPSFYYFRLFTSGLTGRWTIIASGDMNTIVLPDLTVASETGISGLKSGLVSMRSYAVVSRAFDISNYDSSNMYTSMWSTWSTQSLITKLPAAF